MEKLVRNNMPDIAKTPMTYRIAERGEMDKFLAAKLIEEAKEVGVELEKQYGDNLIEELADVMQVIDAIKCFAGITDEQIEDTRIAKELHRGSFLGGVIWDGKY